MAAKIQDILKLKQSVSNLIKVKKDRFLSVEFEALIAALASRKILTEIEMLNYHKAQEELNSLRQRNTELEQKVKTLMQDNWSLLRKLRRYSQKKSIDQTEEEPNDQNQNFLNATDARTPMKVDDDSTGSTRMSALQNDNIMIIDNTDELKPKRSVAVVVPYKYRLEKPKFQHSNTYRYNGRKKILKPTKVEYISRLKPTLSCNEEYDQRSGNMILNGIRSSSMVSKARESQVHLLYNSFQKQNTVSETTGTKTTRKYLNLNSLCKNHENGIDSSWYNNMSDRKI